MTHLDTEDVRLLVVGGGKAGKSLAMDRAKAGWSVAIVERDKIGGTCINVACIPTKALVGSARSLLMARRASAMGVHLDDEPAISLDALRGHKESVVGRCCPPTRRCSPSRGWTSSWAPPASLPPHRRDPDPERRHPTDPRQRRRDQPPELARVDMTETEARRTGHRVAVAQIRVSAIPRAKTLHDTTGSWKVVVDADTGQILGAALLGHNAGEVISTLQVAVLGGLPYQRVRDAVLTHPTMGEGLNLLFDALADQPAHRAAHQPSSDEIPSG